MNPINKIFLLIFNITLVISCLCVFLLFKGDWILALILGCMIYQSLIEIRILSFLNGLNKKINKEIKNEE